jgi:predicted amidophosphoribosyltransferase
MLDGAECPNWLCADPTRSITRIRAIAYSSGALRTRILRYKYDGMWGWSLIFGRLLLAWLDRTGREVPPDLVVANPTFAASGSATPGHTERVIAAAAKEDVLSEWLFDVTDPPSIVKTRATEKSARNVASVKRAAAAELRQALTIPNRSRVEGRRILVYDDVCTTGSQLNAVAECLIEHGHAVSVEGIVLGRAPWRRREG